MQLKKSELGVFQLAFASFQLLAQLTQLAFASFQLLAQLTQRFREFPAAGVTQLAGVIRSCCDLWRAGSYWVRCLRFDRCSRLIQPPSTSDAINAHQSPTASR